MAEQKQIPTITILEEDPPSLEIITFYEELVDKPHILRAFIAPIGGRISLGVAFLHGEQGIIMKNWPTLIEATIQNDGELNVFAEDPENYFLDSKGDLRYHIAGAWKPTDHVDLAWDVDFSRNDLMSLGGGNEISSITNAGGVSGSWIASGVERPIWDGVETAIWDGIDDRLLASFVELSRAGTLFIIGSSFIVDGTAEFLSSGRNDVSDGDHILFRHFVNDGNLVIGTRQTSVGSRSSNGRMFLGDDTMNLLTYVGDMDGGLPLTDINLQKFPNGYLDDVLGQTLLGAWFFRGTPNEMRLGSTVKTTPTFSKVKIKRVTYFTPILSEVDRICAEIYFRFKYNLPVYSQSFLLSGQSDDPSV